MVANWDGDETEWRRIGNGPPILAGFEYHLHK